MKIFGCLHPQNQPSGEHFLAAKGISCWCFYCRWTVKKCKAIEKVIEQPFF